jgi:hypothetical protein
MDEVDDFIKKFIATKKIGDEDALRLGKGVKDLYNKTPDLFLKRVYLKMLPYIYSLDKKISSVFADEKTVSAALGYLKNDKFFLEYQKAYGNKFGLYYYLKNKPAVADKLFGYLVEKNLLKIQKTTEEIEKELRNFLMNAEDEKFNKEVSSFKEAKFERPTQIIGGSLLYLRRKKNPTSEPVLKPDGSPLIKAEKKSQPQETSSQQQAPQSEEKQQQLLQGIEKEFFELYSKKVIVNLGYNEFVSKKKTKYKGLDFNMYLGYKLQNGDESVYQKNRLPIINSILEWIGKEPLTELPAKQKDFEKLLKDLIKEINDKLKQSSSLNNKKRLAIA